MNLKTFTLTLESTEKIKGDAPKLRGFFATKFNEYQELHQHSANGFIYKYPLVQYKMIDGTPTVIGINAGAEVLKDIFDKFDEVRLGENTYPIMSKGIRVMDQDFGISGSFHKYEFATPWFALSQENYRKFYTAGSRDARSELMNRILVGNILSMSKTFGYTVPDRIKANVDYKARKSHLKETTTMTFTGTFAANFQIPDYLGIGKSVSRGFGAVRRLEPSRNP